MAAVKRLSKSRFIADSQCHLRLWHDIHQRDLATPVDDLAQFIFDTGHEVGELACRRYPSGRLVGGDHLHFDEAIAETRQLIADGDATVLFEPAFEHGGVVARADILEKLPTGGWRMIEVKSTTRVKDVFILDAAIQLWILRGTGLDVRDTCILTLDNTFVRTAEAPDPEKLFRLRGIHEEAVGLLDTVGTDVQAMHKVISSAAPLIEPGDHCHRPYPCPYFAHCIRNAPHLDHGLDELPRLSAEKRAQLDASGVREVRDIPPEFPMSFTQHLIRRAVVSNADIVRGDLAGSLAEIRPPVRHLDFETFAPAIPRFPAPGPTRAFHSFSRYTPSATADRRNTRTTCTSAPTIHAGSSPTASYRRSAARDRSASTRVSRLE